MVGRLSKYSLAALLLLSLIFAACTGQEEQEPTEETVVLKGPYLGQTPPGMEAQLFAPGVITTFANERDIATTPDASEIYFCRQLGNYSLIMRVKMVDDVWQEPEVAPFSGKYDDIEPAISPDGKHFFWVSKRPLVDGGKPKEDWDIWFAERTEDGWGAPENLGAPINNELNQFFPSITDSGAIYFNQRNAQGEFIYKSDLVDGEYQEPVKLPAEINAGRFQFNAFVAPDESYIIVPSGPRKGAIGGIDYYISFKQEDGSWSETVNMGPKINSVSRSEYSAFVSRDGKYLFFLTDRLGKEAEAFSTDRGYAKLMYLSAKPGNGSKDIYWINASVIEELRP